MTKYCHYCRNQRYLRGKPCPVCNEGDIREKIADEYYEFTVKQGWKLAGYERAIREKSHEYADQITPLLNARMGEANLKGFMEGVKKTTDACDSTYGSMLKHKVEEARKQERIDFGTWLNLSTEIFVRKDKLKHYQMPTELRNLAVLTLKKGLALTQGDREEKE